jgi:hypothetical protein
MLNGLAKLVSEIGAIDWLLLPEMKAGEFSLTDSEWNDLGLWIQENSVRFNLRISTEATSRLKAPFLLSADTRDYAHIAADGYVRRCSYDSGGICVHGQSLLESFEHVWLEEAST